jgi:cell division protease FtsH
MERLAQALLEYETLTGEEIKNLLEGKPPVRDAFDEPPPSRSSAVPTTRPKPKGGEEPGGPGLEPQPG